MLLKTGEEDRYAEAMHSTSSAERWLLEKTRIKSAAESTRTKFSPVSRKRSRLCDRSVLPRDHHWLRSPDVNGREKLRLIWLMSMVFGVVMVLKGIGMML
jgi:hypothetical protein